VQKEIVRGSALYGAGFIRRSAQNVPELRLAVVLVRRLAARFALIQMFVTAAAEIVWPGEAGHYTEIC
jgi:hypothetical protein